MKIDKNLILNEVYNLILSTSIKKEERIILINFKEKNIERGNIDKEILELGGQLRKLALKNLSRRQVMSEEMNFFYKKISAIKEKELNIGRGIGSFAVVRWINMS